MKSRKLLVLASALFFLIPLYASAQVDLELDLRPTIVKPGDEVQVTIGLKNLTHEPLVFDAWMTISDPSGIAPKVFRPVTVKLRPGEAVKLVKTYCVPLKTRPGRYIVTANCGRFPKEIWDADREILTIK